MEHAIGTRIILEDGRVVEVVRVRSIKLPYKLERWLSRHHLYTSPCKKCALSIKGLPMDCLEYACIPSERTDHKNIIYKEIKED